MMLLGVFLPLYTPQAKADWWQDMWKTQDQQGLQAYQEQQFESAAEKFNDPLWLGSALYKKQDYEQALSAFSQVDTVDARYNQANTLAQLGKYPEAIKMYETVLSEQSGFKDAAANKALLEKLLEQQQKNDQQNNESEQQDDSQQQDQQDQQKSDSSQQDQQDQQSQDQQDSEQQSQDESAESQQNDSEQQSEQQQQEKEQAKSQEAEQKEQKKSEQEAKDASDETEQQAMAEQAKELTDEEKEQMQRMQTLLNRVPDDPAFLLKRKMQIEAQQRKRERVPSNLQRNW